MKRHSPIGAIPSLCATALAFLCAAALSSPAAGADTMAQRCSQTARAYASGELGNVQGVEFLTTCVRDRMKTASKMAEKKKGKEPAANNPLICHRYAGRFSVHPEALSHEDLAYLENCLETDAHNQRKGD